MNFFIIHSPSFKGKFYLPLSVCASCIKNLFLTLIFLLTFLFLSDSELLAQTVTITKTIAVGTDDAEEEGPTGINLGLGGMLLNSPDIELVSDFQAPAHGVQKIGLRFTGITIPQGATITGAYLTFRALIADAPMTNSDTTNLTVKGQKISNAPTFTSTINNISSRALTTASTSWVPSSWTTGVNYNSPSIVSVIQEIVNQGTWESGNAMAIIISGTGHRASPSFEADAINAPKLVITYTTSPPIILTSSVSNILCRGNATGAINLTVSGGTAPFQYDWSYNGITQPGSYPDSQDISGLAAGSYVVYVKDAMGNTQIATYTITQPGTSMTLSTTVADVTSSGGTNGAIDLTVTGGTPSYSYLWSGGALTQDRTGLLAGTYTVTVTDANGCSSIKTTSVIEVINQTLVTKQLYLDGSLGLSRDNPVNPIDNTTSSSATLGTGVEKSLFSIFGNNSTNFQRYSISSNTWSSKAAIPNAARQGGSLTTSGSFIYALSGNASTNFARYNPVTNTWSTMAAIPSTVSNGGALVAAEGFIYAFRGTNTSSFYRYNITTNTWSTMANAPSNVEYGSSMVYDGTKIYAFGGNNTTNFWSYNIGANSWTSMTSAPAQVKDGGALTYDGINIYGLRGSGQKDFWRYNIAANTWTTLAIGLANFDKGAGIVFDGKYFYAQRGAGQKTFYRYDKGTNIWTTMAPTTINISDGGALTVFGDGNQGVGSVTFTEAPGLCSSLTVKAGQTLTIQNYISIINGTMPANPNISAELKYGTTTIATFNNPIYSGGLLTWSSTLATDVTIPAGQSITLTVSTAQSGVSFQIRYDSQTYPSKISLPVSTFINVNSVEVYSASYPNGSLITNLSNTGNSYIRIAVSDPFGTTDINGVNLTLTMPDNSTVNITLNESAVKNVSGCVKTYQYVLANPVSLGSWHILAVAKEGTEGAVTHLKSATVTVIVPTGPVTQNKQLYFNDALGLDRSNPLNPIDNSIAQTSTLSLATAPTTVTLTASSDAGIWNNNPTDENKNYGNCDKLYINGPSGTSKDRSMVKFDLSSIPSNAIISSAIYSLVKVGGSNTSLSTSVHQVTNDWTEGAGGCGGTAGIVNWNKRMTSTDWNTPGGDFNATAESSIAIAGNGTYSWGVTNLVQNWVGGSSANYGFITKYTTENVNAQKDFGSSENSTLESRPSLTITYTIPGNLSTTFTQSPVLCSPLTIKAQQTISVSAFVSVISGAMPVNPSITSTLKYGATNIATLSAPIYSSGTNLLTWTTTLPSDITIPEGQAIALDITTSQSGVTFKIDYDSQTKPSLIDLPVSTYIDINSNGMYNAPYPGGTLISNAQNSTTGYLRSVVSSPFGFNDISALNIDILKPNGITESVVGIVMNTSGCTKTFEYVWNTTATPGDYSFTSTAKEGTENTGIDIAFLDFSLCPLTLTASIITLPDCNDPNSGLVNLNVTGSYGPFTWAWTRVSPAGSGSGSGTSIGRLSAGTYDISVFSAGGCSGTTSTTLATPIGPTFTYVSNNASCLGNDGTIELTTISGSGIYSYFWSDGITTKDRNFLIPGFYSVTVTDDATGCASSASIEINAGLEVGAKGIISNVSCIGKSDGFINLTPSGGSGVYTFAWSDGPITKNRTNLPVGNYVVTISDNGGCKKVLSFNIVAPPAINIVSVVTQPTCSENGSIEITTTGGTPNYNYDWTDVLGAINFKNRAGLNPGSYMLKVTDAKACTSSVSFTMNTPVCVPNLIPVCTSTTTDVFSVDLDPTVTSYVWTVPSGAVIVSGQGTNSIIINWTSANSGTNQVCVKSVNNCGESFLVCKPVSIRKVTPVLSAITPICEGSNLYLGANGATNYSWSGPLGFNSSLENPILSGATLANSGTYKITATDSYGCVGTASLLVIVLPAPSASLIPNAADCGIENGSIDLTPSGGTLPYSYLWSNAENTQNLINLAGGTYQVNIRDSNGCAVTENITVDNKLAHAVTLTPNHVACFGDATGSITAMLTGGVAPFTYFWSIGSTTQNITGLRAKNYSVLVTDSTGCIASASTDINETEELLISHSKIDVSCLGGSNGNVNLTISGGIAPFSYDWNTIDGAGIVSGIEDQSALKAGTYSILVTDANACVRQLTVIIKQPSAVLGSIASKTDISCNGASDGNIVLNTIGGTSPYSYNWDDLVSINDPKDRNGLSPATYNVTVTDANGCTTTASASIIQPVVLSLSFTSVAVGCNGGTDGSIDLSVSGGTTGFGYTYIWSNGTTTQDLISLSAGTYNVIVKDGNNCSANASITISEPTILSSTTTLIAASCFGTASGSATISVIGGTPIYSFLWSNGETSKDLMGVAVGNYSVIITDINGCKGYANAVVSEPNRINISSIISDVLCKGGATGAINVTATGGTNAYTYDWLDLAGSINLEDRTSLNTGTYTLTVSSPSGCSSDPISIAVNEPSDLELSMVNTNATCFGSTDGNIILTTSGGMIPYSFAWSNSAITKDISGLAAGVYTVTVTDANGCTKMLSSLPISVPEALNVSLTKVNNACFNGITGSLTANTSGGSGTFTYLWSTGAITPIINGLLSGNYSVNVSDEKGCSETSSGTITQPSSDITIYDEVNQTSCGGDNGKINLTVTGGGSTYTYLWSNSAITEDVTSLAIGTYFVRVIDDLGCESNKSSIVTSLPPLTAAITTIATNCLGDNGSAFAIPTSGVAPFTYLWSTTNGSASANGVNLQNITGLKAGTYSVLITEGNGCTATASAVVDPSAINCKPPVAKNDSYFIPINTLLTGTVGPNLPSDEGYDSDSEDSLNSLTFIPLTTIDFLKGTIVWDSTYNGAFIFTPAIGFRGQVSVKYQVCDLTNLCSTASLIITIATPIANPDGVIPISFTTIIPVLENDINSDDSQIIDLSKITTPFVSRPPLKGNAIVNIIDGTITYNPNPGELGLDTFIYMICDKLNTSICDTALVILNILAGPIANSDSVKGVTAGTVANIGNIVANDKKGIGTSATPVEFTVDLDETIPGDQSTLVVIGEGTWTYNPTTGFADFTPLISFRLDPTSIVYKLTETQTGKSDTAKLIVDYVPVALDDTSTYDLGFPKTIDVLVNDTNGDSILPNSVEIMTANVGSNGKTKTVSGQGVWTVNPISGTITFTPSPGFIGNPGPINYTAKDNDANISNAALVTLISNSPSLVDVELFKTTNAPCQVNVDDIVTFTLKVFRKDNSLELVNLTVKDSLSSNLMYVSHTVSEGTFDVISGVWTGINLAKGDTAIFTLLARVMTSTGGLSCNTAWVFSQDKADVDSQAGNQNLLEDDISKVCISIPILLCSNRGEKILLSSPSGYTDYIWKRNGSVIQGENLSTYLASQSGSYTVEILNLNPCGSVSCCPVIITDYCECLDKIWVPVHIQKSK